MSRLDKLIEDEQVCDELVRSGAVFLCENNADCTKSCVVDLVVKHVISML